MDVAVNEVQEIETITTNVMNTIFSHGKKEGYLGLY
jgi:hypothetical protein